MRKFRQFVLLACAAALCSCGSVRPSKYYTLEVPSGSGAPAASVNPYAAALLVGRLSTPHLYRDTRVVYRTGATEIGTYEYHRWVEPPTDMLEAALMRVLRASGKYTSVQRQGANARGDYIVRGRLNEFGEVNAGALTARVSFEMDLYDVKSGTTVWSHLYSHDEPVNGKEVPAVVEALNRNAQAGIAEVAASLDRFFASKK